MKIIGEDSSFIQFKFIASEVESTYEIVLLEITFSSEGFSGQKGVEIFRGDLKNFASELQTLENKRQGEAVLKCMSYPSVDGGIDFKIHSIDRLGHLAATIELQKINYSRNNLAPLTVTGSFEIDTSSLPAILCDFQTLAAARSK